MNQEEKEDYTGLLWSAAVLISAFSIYQNTGSLWYGLAWMLVIFYTIMNWLIVASWVIAHNKISTLYTLLASNGNRYNCGRVRKDLESEDLAMFHKPIYWLWTLQDVLVDFALLAALIGSQSYRAAILYSCPIISQYGLMFYNRMNCRKLLSEVEYHESRNQNAIT